MDVELAELTPAGRGAVSVLRVRGPDAAAFVRNLSGREFPAGTARFVRLRLAGEDLDEAIVCRLPDGEFELHLHGSPVLVERLVAGVRSAAGAPTDLESLAAEALARAPAECAARILLDQAEGALARELRGLLGAESSSRERSLDALAERWRIARRALEPPEIVLAGSANAGKSTLFNALLGESRAIVDPRPGTTRDVLRESALLGAWPVRLVDTAGERELGRDGEARDDDEIEREGQSRGGRARAEADLVFWLAPASAAEPRPPPGPRTTVVRTFADRCPSPALARDAISALRDPAGARARIGELHRRAFALPEDPWRSGTAVPFRDDLAAAIERLRGRSGTELERGVQAILAGGFAVRSMRS